MNPIANHNFGHVLEHMSLGAGIGIFGVAMIGVAFFYFVGRLP